MKMIPNKDANRIEVGDIVCVDFNNAQFTLCKKGEVLHILPNGWIIKDEETGRIHDISEGCTVSLIKKGEQEDVELPF